MKEGTIEKERGRREGRYAKQCPTKQRRWLF